MLIWGYSPRHTLKPDNVSKQHPVAPSILAA